MFFYYYSIKTFFVWVSTELCASKIDIGYAFWKYKIKLTANAHAKKYNKTCVIHVCISIL